MKVFKACLKKEVLEEVRTKRFFYLLGLMVGIVALVYLMMAIMQGLNLMLDETTSEEISVVLNMFDFNYYSAYLMFSSFVVTYFSIVSIIMLMRNISKEIQDKKWITPISSGISPSVMIGAKIAVKVLSVAFACFLGCLLHFIITISTCSALQSSTISFGIGDLLLGYFCLIMIIIFISTLTICVNAISKKAWVSAVVGLIVLIFVTTILESISVDGNLLITYTPLVFYEVGLTNATLGVAQWVIGSVSYVLVLGVLIFFAIHTSKIKTEKIK